VLHQLRNPLLFCLLGGLVVGRLLWPTASKSETDAHC
jgi:hypothetical protein